MKISAVPKRGRKDSVVYLETRHGKVARQYVRSANPRSPEQVAHRNNVRAVSARWGTLAAEQQAAWCVAAAKEYFVTETGRRIIGVHGIRTKGQAIPARDLDTARERMRDWKNRNEA